MPYKLRKAPKRELYWVVNVETKQKYSKDPIPLNNAKAQMRVLQSAMKNEVRGGMRPAGKQVLDELEAHENRVRMQRGEAQPVPAQVVPQGPPLSPTDRRPIRQPVQLLPRLQARLEALAPQSRRPQPVRAVHLDLGLAAPAPAPAPVPAPVRLPMHPRTETRVIPPPVDIEREKQRAINRRVIDLHKTFSRHHATRTPIPNSYFTTREHRRVNVYGDKRTKQQVIEYLNEVKKERLGKYLAEQGISMRTYLAREAANDKKKREHEQEEEEKREERPSRTIESVRQHRQKMRDEDTEFYEKNPINAENMKYIRAIEKLRATDPTREGRYTIEQSGFYPDEYLTEVQPIPYTLPSKGPIVNFGPSVEQTPKPILDLGEGLAIRRGSIKSIRSNLTSNPRPHSVNSLKGGIKTERERTIILIEQLIKRLTNNRQMIINLRSQGVDNNTLQPYTKLGRRLDNEIERLRLKLGFTDEEIERDFGYVRFEPTPH